MEHVAHALLIKSQTLAILKTEDAEISHAVNMKDVKQVDSMMDNVDQTHAQLASIT
tara:strand:- start:165 stop:332 length:168 start_codon:yes stop_codon:yes gene_type:complete